MSTTDGGPTLEGLADEMRKHADAIQESTGTIALPERIRSWADAIKASAAAKLDGLTEYLRIQRIGCTSPMVVDQLTAWIDGLEASTAAKPEPTDDEIRAVWNREQDPIKLVRALASRSATGGERERPKRIGEAPTDGTPVLLFSEGFIDDDFCPTGWVEGHCCDGAWQAAIWNGYTDQWDTREVVPTHFQPLPAPIKE